MLKQIILYQCLSLLISCAYDAISFKVMLTQDLVSQSFQQAVDSSVSALVNFNGQHGIPLWSIKWMIDDGTTNITVGQGRLLSDLVLHFVKEPNPYSDAGILSFSNDPAVLSTSTDPITLQVTLQHLLISHSGLRFFFSSTGVPTEGSNPLQVKYCIKSQGSLVKIKTNTNLCGYGCLGSYECPRGYDMLQSASIMCLENATWNVTDKDCVFDSASANSQIAPKAVAIEKIYAAGVRGLLLPAVVDKISVLNCQWHFLFDGQFNSFGKTVEVVKGGLCASKVIAGTNETVTCKTTNTSFLSDITLHKRMNFGKLFATFTCDGMNYVNASLNIVYCPFRQNHMLISRRSRKCGYLCEGNLTCPLNQFATAGRKVVCQKNAEWNITDKSCDIVRLRSWRLIPGNYSVYACGFPNLIANVIIRNSHTLNCSWIYDGEFSRYDFLVRGACEKNTQGARDRISCMLNDEGSLISELQINYELKPGPFAVSFQCNGDAYFTTTVNAQHCLIPADSAITYTGLDCGYRCNATYKCPTGSSQPSIKAECGVNAEWKFDRMNCIMPNVTNGCNELRLNPSTFSFSIKFSIMFLILIFLYD